MKRHNFSRREAVARFASFLAASPLLSAQQAPTLEGERPGRIAPFNQLANTHEFEPMAKRKLDRAVFASVAETTRDGFHRITFRPRLMVNTLALDLTTKLFEHSMFAPIIVGPVSHQKQFHIEGELAVARGCAEAKSLMVLADRTDTPIEQISEQAKSGLWYQVYAEGNAQDTLGRIEKAVAASCAAVVVTAPPGKPEPNWKFFERIRAAVSVPLLFKGVMEPKIARDAIKKGANGIVVSNHGGSAGDASTDPIIALPKITDAVGSDVPILIDGGFRRGSDVLKALALGASSVLVSRPVIWGLAAYGTDGVRTVIELMQTELARDMTMLGTVNIDAIGPNHVRIHSR